MTLKDGLCIYIYLNILKVNLRWNLEFGSNNLPLAIGSKLKPLAMEKAIADLTVLKMVGSLIVDRKLSIAMK